MFSLLIVVLISSFGTIVQSELSITSPLLAQKRLDLSNVTAIWTKLLSTEEAQTLRAIPDLLYANAMQKGNVTTCQNDIAVLVSAIAKSDKWTYPWLDAQGKPPPGLIEGAVYWPGSFDVCLKSVGYRPNRQFFHGKYCSLFVPLNFDAAGVEFGTSIGMCIPDSCSLSDIISFVETQAPMVGASQYVKINADMSQCQSKSSTIEKDTWFWCAILLLAFIIALAFMGLLVESSIWLTWMKCAQPCSLSQSNGFNHVAGIEACAEPMNITEVLSANGATKDSKDLKLAPTSYKEYRMNFIRKNPAVAVLSAFSFPYNAWRLVSAQPRSVNGAVKEEQLLEFLDGFKLISMVWIILGHAFGYAATYCNNALAAMDKMLSSWSFQFVISGTLAVDTFFFISGLLAVRTALQRYTRLPNCVSRIKFWFAYALHRFLRMTPTYAVVLILYTGLFNHLHRGPLYPTKPGMNDIKNCRSHGYVSYLNNMVKVDERCMGWTWYLADDLQFSLVLAPIFIIATACHFSIGLVFSGLLMLSAAVIMTVRSYQFDFPLLPSLDLDFWRIYVAPYTRWGTYAMGLVMGWMLLKYQQFPNHYSKQARITIRTVLLSIVIFLIGITLYGRAGVANRTLDDPGRLVRAIYHGFNRFGFSLALAILTYLLANRWLDWIAALLSTYWMRLLARLTFGAYLVHPLVLQFSYTARATPVMMDCLFLTNIFISTTALSFMGGFLLAVFIEAPCIRLEALARRGSSAAA